MKLITSFRSPNFNERPAEPVSVLVLHYTGMPAVKDALERLCDKEAQVSAHYVVSEEGAIYQLVNEDKRAWHAGVSHWRGRDSLNDLSIGVEIANPGHEFGYRLFPPVQMDAVTELCLDILNRHDIPACNVVGHSDIAPLRKDDPGELFDWAWLATQGVGLWPGFGHGDRRKEPRVRDANVLSVDFKQRRKPVDRRKSLALSKGQTGEDVKTLQIRLRRYGYGITEDGVFGEKTEKVIMAFQRHFRPESITGVWDNECESRLACLLALI